MSARPRRGRLGIGLALLVVVGAVVGLEVAASGQAPAGAPAIGGHLALTTCVAEPCVDVGGQEVPAPSPGTQLRVPWQKRATFVAQIDGSARRLPAPYALTCPTPQHCVGLVSATLPIVTTDDGGTRWTAQRGPAGATSLSSLSCWSARACAVLADTAYAPFLWSTRDGGASWRRVDGPLQTSGDDDLSCPTSSFCVSDAMSYLSPGADVAWSTGPTAPWHFAALSRQVQTESQLVDCPSAGRCVAAYATQNHGLQVLASEDGARTWHPVTTITTRVEVDQQPSGIVCDAALRCLIGIETFDSPHNAALYVDVADHQSVVRYFPSGSDVLPLGGPVCHGSACDFFVTWRGTIHLAPVGFDLGARHS